MSITELTRRLMMKRSEIPAQRSVLAGISGIDACGKGFITSRIAERLPGHKIAVINVDGWLNLPQIRFDSDRPAENFYENAIRLGEMFDKLILPLRETRNTSITIDQAEETATEFHPHRYEFSDIDIILLEGIFIFRRQFVEHFDLKIWIECSFESALKRAVARSQEGLAPGETMKAYESIYFPAQLIHFERDEPLSHADFIFPNCS